MNKKFQRKIKRLADLILSFIGLIILSPLFLIVSVLVKLDSKGTVFFRYERVGENEKSFKPFKFRTLKQGAIKEGLGFNISEEDKRITKLGRILRKWSIDELPQLINVLRGEMSLVGPRPVFRYQVEKYNDFQRKRLLVKPGITGWALIHGRNLLSWEERIKYDVWYVENWSLFLDLKILLKTIKIVLLKEGLYGEGGINDPFI